MDKNRELNSVILNHTININERKSISLSGIKKLNSFDDKEFFLESVMGCIIIQGEELELLKLDTFQGTISIKGKINLVNYLEDGNRKQKAESIMSRLFK